ncbi:MAG: transposase [Desulfobacter sp.]|uniref:Tn3 family transposase n=1 Tax=uncultured Desulfobacter sp. TaxID=240139 RepID=UPI0029C7D02D|nr:Tn3 family transposase [uncultured Desulfobacter sp.]MCW8800767.1 transposase [Desulfobacter sp.]
MGKINNPDMRSNVLRSLNRGEALHQLISAIRKIGEKKLSGKNEIEMEMHNECNRLVANCIIFYNAVLLSDLYKAYNKQDGYVGTTPKKEHFVIQLPTGDLDRLYFGAFHGRTPP